MPVLPPNTPPNGGKKPQGKWAQRSKQLSFWVLIILIPVLFLQLQNGKGDQARTIRYDQYTEQLERGNVAKVTIQSGAAIVGEFAEKVPINGRPERRFSVKLPVRDSE